MKNENFLIKGDFVYRSEDLLHAQSATSSTIHLKDGRFLIDLEAANGAALLGYDSSLINSAIQDIQTLPMLPSFVESDLRLELASRLATSINQNIGEQGKVAFDLGGGQGIELALKIAAKYNPNKHTIIVLEGCYHGRSITTSFLSSSPRYRNSFSQSSFNIIRLPVPELNPKWGSYALEYCMAYLERLFEDECCGLVSKNQNDILGFIYEPIINVAGLVKPSSQYLQQIIHKVRELGGVVIADEIFTGFYRCGSLLASKQQGIVPDLIVMSKVITNGITPLSLVWGKEALVTESIFPPGEHSVTFGNSLIAFAIAQRVLDRVLKTTEEEIRKISEFLIQFTNILAKSLGSHISHYSVDALTARIQFSQDVKARQLKAKMLKGVDIDGRKYGLLAASTGLAKDTLMLHPAITIQSEEMDIALEISKCISDYMTSR